MANRKVVVDMDGVLADFEGEFCKEFGYDKRELVSLESRYPEHARKIVEFVNDGFVYRRLKPIQLGLDIVNYLNELYMDVIIITARPYYTEPVSRQWLNKNHISFCGFYQDTSKTGRITLLKPLLAVDDLFSVHLKLLKHNIPTIVVAQPWNNYKHENMRRISNLYEFSEQFNEIMEGLTIK
jgi:5'(3')-deoxyribonucleotidase